MTFLDAFTECITGKHIRRPSWRQGQFVDKGKFNFRWNLVGDGKSFTKFSYTLSVDDFKAEDWIVIKNGWPL